MATENGTTKYFQVMDRLRQQILSGEIKPGGKLPSENELSREYGISRHTVRKALRILENDGYVEAQHGRGTFCSERMGHMKRSKNIAVVTTYLSDYIFPRLIQGIDKVLSQNGYSIILKNTGNSRQKEAQQLEELLEKDIDGLIIEPSKSQLFCRHIHLYQKLDEYQIPYVFIQGLYEQLEEKPHILMDDCQGGYLVTKYLASLGHRHIAGVFKADDSQGRERHKGYVRALQVAGLCYDPDWVIWYHTEDRNNKPAVVIGNMLRKKIPVDGIVCYNDQIAIQVIQALRAEGLGIPQDVSVTGYDNSHFAQWGEIGLTTIDHPQEKLGEMAAEYLLEKIQGVSPENSQVTCLIEPKLIIRDSCRSRDEKKNND